MRHPENMQNLCTCGHYKNVHLPSDNIFCNAVCLSCHPGENWGYHINGWYRVHEFKLDNLKYIEDLAKEKKLI